MQKQRKTVKGDCLLLLNNNSLVIKQSQVLLVPPQGL